MQPVTQKGPSSLIYFSQFKWWPGNLLRGFSLIATPSQKSAWKAKKYKGETHPPPVHLSCTVASISEVTATPVEKRDRSAHIYNNLFKLFFNRKLTSLPYSFVFRFLFTRIHYL
jgi:hypothetical protein